MVSAFEKLLEREREKHIFTPEGVLKEKFRSGAGPSRPSAPSGPTPAQIKEAEEKARLEEEIKKRQTETLEKARLQKEIEKRQAKDRAEEKRISDIRERAVRRKGIGTREKAVADLSRRINLEQDKKVREANERLRKDLAEGRSREIVLANFNRDIALAQLEAQQKRRDAGISVPTPPPERQPGVELVEGGRERAVSDFITRRGEEITEAKERETEATTRTEAQEETELGVIGKLQQRLEESKFGRFIPTKKQREKIKLLLIPEEERKRREIRKEKAVKFLEKGVDIFFKPIPQLEAQKGDLITKVEDLEKGFIKGAITFPVREPEKFLILGGIGQALPLVIPKVTTGIATVLGGGKAAVVTAKTATTLGGVALAGKFAMDVTQQVRAAETFEAKGEILGETFVEIGLLGGVRKKPAFVLKKPFPELREELLPKKPVVRKVPTDIEVLKALRQIREEARFKRVPRARRIGLQRFQAQTEKLLQQERLRQVAIKRIDPLQQVREAIKSELKLRLAARKAGILKEEFRIPDIQKITLERFKAQQRATLKTEKLRQVSKEKVLGLTTQTEKDVISQLARDIKITTKIKELGLLVKPKVRTRIKAPPPKKPGKLTIAEQLFEKISIETTKKPKDLTIAEQLLRKKGDVFKVETFEKIIDFEPIPTKEFKVAKLRELSLKRLKLLEVEQQLKLLKRIKPSKIGLETLKRQQRISKVIKERISPITQAERDTINQLARDIKFLQKAATPEKKFGIEITKPKAKRSIAEELFKKRGSLLKQEEFFIKPEQRGLIKFQREQRILESRKELQFPGQALRKLRESLVTEIKKQPSEIKELALKRLKQQRISRAISEGKKINVEDLSIRITKVKPRIKLITEPKPETIIKIFKEEPPIKPTTIRGRQQLIQVLKEPEIIEIIKPKVRPPKVKPRITDVFEDLETARIKRLFPGFAEPTTKFKALIGKIPPFEDLGKVSELGLIQGRIPGGILKGIEKEIIPTGLLGKVKVVGKDIQIQLEKEISRKPKIKPIIKPTLDVEERLFLGFPTKEKAKTIIEEDLAFAQPQVQRQPEVLKFIQPQETIQSLIITPILKQPQKLKQPEEKILKQITEEIGKKEGFGAFLFRRKGFIGLEPIDTQPFDVFAKSIKTKKLRKINKVPLSKSRAEDLRNYIIDTSLSRSGEIRPGRGKIKNPLLDVPVGYASETEFKFRRFRQVKGKRVPLKQGAIIERGNFLLDTTQEVNDITLSKRIAQLQKRKVSVFNDLDSEIIQQRGKKKRRTQDILNVIP